VGDPPSQAVARQVGRQGDWVPTKMVNCQVTEGGSIISLRFQLRPTRLSGKNLKALVLAKLLISIIVVL